MYSKLDRRSVLLGLGLSPLSGERVFGEEASGRGSEHVDFPKKVPTVEQIVGGMIIVGFNGTTPGDGGVARVMEWLGRGEIGGVILFEDNIVSPEQVSRLTQAFRKVAVHSPPLIMIDQEGGAASRLRLGNGFTNLPSAQVMSQDPNLADAFTTYYRTAVEMSRSGINVNLGPVVDLNLNHRNPIIARKQRSFGNMPGQVIRYARMFIAAHRKAGLLTVAKHFPGHGSSAGDTHKHIVDITDTWRVEEVTPYRDLASDSFVEMVMTGHIVLNRFGSDNVPASLSGEIVNTLLRRYVGFGGVVLTDDLDMEAIRSVHSRTQAATLALQAGNDIALISNRNPPDIAFPVSVIRSVVRAVSADNISDAALHRSFDRIQTAKKHLLELQAAVKEAGAPPFN